MRVGGTSSGGRTDAVGPVLRSSVFVLMLALTSGCTASPAAPTATGRASPGPGHASGVDRPPVLSYARAPKAVRAVLDHSGLEPVLEGDGALLAIGQHVVVAGDVDSHDLYEMALEGDLAVNEIDRLDGRTFNGRVLILAPATQSEYDSWGGAGHGDAWGITHTPGWKGGHNWIALDLAQRGILAATLKDDSNLLRHVVTHELFHALTLPGGSHADAPLWLVEGFAEVAAQQVRALGPATPPARITLPTNRDFGSTSDSYFQAWQFAAYLVRHEGRARAMRFYFRAVASHDRTTLGALSRRCLGSSLAALERRWEHAYARRGPLGT